MTKINSVTNINRTPKKYPCPNCKKMIIWKDNLFKPFCSERCKMIDLGAWANEDYKIASIDADIFSSDFE